MVDVGHRSEGILDVRVIENCNGMYNLNRLQAEEVEELGQQCCGFAGAWRQIFSAESSLIPVGNMRETYFNVD